VKSNSGFDFLAPVYDPLARLIFGKSIVYSQTWFLNQVPPKAKVLILGGGTGWFLEELIKQSPSCTVWYVDASFKMIEKTRERLLGDRVNLIHGTEDDIPTSLTFDVIITNFYLDLFSEEKLEKIIQRLSFQTHSSSRWLVTDFVDGGVWWQQCMLKIMYTFFRGVCDIEANRLPNWTNCLNNHRWMEDSCKNSYGDFIRSAALCRK
jgi:tRNA (cmo5U34)-methyltransferase